MFTFVTKRILQKVLQYYGKNKYTEIEINENQIQSSRAQTGDSSYLMTSP